MKASVERESPLLKFYWYHDNTLINSSGGAGTFGCYEVVIVGDTSQLKVSCGGAGSGAGSFRVWLVN